MVSEDEMDVEVLNWEEMEIFEAVGVPRLVLTKQERKKLWKPWMRALIVKVIGKSLPYHFLTERLHIRWRVQGDLKVIDVGNGYYVVTFPSWEDRTRVLTEGP